MGATLPGGTNRKEGGSSSLMQGVAEVTLGSGLLNAMISKQRCVEDGMAFEASVFEDAIQRFRTELTGAGLNPDEVVSERIRLLTEAIQKPSEK